MIRGTSLDQDSRFKDKSKKMLQQSTWPDKYDKKIILTKIKMDFLKIWIQKKITELLGYEDDIVSGTALSLLEQYLEKQQGANAKKIHVALSGFLTSNTVIFMSELWDYLQSANKTENNGIGSSFVEEHLRREKQQVQRLRELQTKKKKIKNYQFDQIIDRYANNRRRNEIEEQRSRNRERSRSKGKKKDKGKDKYRSRSRDRKRHHSKDKKKRKNLKRKSRDISSSESKQRQKKTKHRKQRNRSQSYERSYQQQNNRPQTPNKKHNKQSYKEHKKRKRHRHNSQSQSSSQVVSSSNSRQ